MGVNMSKACKAHDKHYDKGKNKLVSDVKLGRDIIKNNPGKPIRSRIIASGYTWAVIGLGGPSYGLSKHQQEMISHTTSNLRSVSSKARDAIGSAGDLLLAFSPYEASNALAEIVANWAPVVKDVKNIKHGQEPNTWGGSTWKASQCNFDEKCMFGN